MIQSSSSPVLQDPISRFAAQEHRSSSPSPSRSSRRQQHFSPIEPDPLLSNLSPTSTLKVLSEVNIVSVLNTNGRSLLSDSISNASTSERALGIRAALAGKKLKDWYNEVKGWHWPSTGFERRTENEDTVQRHTNTRGGSLDQILTQDLKYALVDGGNRVYWGSMPAEDVQAYEERIQRIRDDMETLDIEELKDHVRGAHLSARTRQQPALDVRNPDSMASPYTHLDDFTAIVTATIMQALPYIFRLNALLDLWTTRLTVIRQVPGWSRRLEDSQVAMEAAWAAIGRVQVTTTWLPSDLTRNAFQTMKSILEEKITGLGQRTDAMLDVLEGGVDHIPDAWIDRLEQLEEDYRGWVVDAERIIFDNEWRQGQTQPRPSLLSETREDSARTLRAGSSPSPETETSTNFDKGKEPCGKVSVDPAAPQTVTSIPAMISTMRESSISPDQSLSREDSDNKTEVSERVSCTLQSRTLPSMPLVHEDTSSRQREKSNESPAADYFSIKEPESILEPRPLTSYSLGAKSSAKTLPVHRPAPLDLGREASIYDSNVSSEMSCPASASSGAFSNMSSPEILSAARIEYFGTPTEIKTPVWASREPLTPADPISHPFSKRSAIEQGSKGPELNTNGSDSTIDILAEPVTTSDSELERPTPVLKRASTTSVEILPKTELRKLTLTRTGSHSSTSSALDRVKNQELPTRRTSTSGADERPSTYIKSHGNTPSSPFSEVEDVQDQSPSVRSYNKKKSVIGPHVQPDLPFGFPKVPINSPRRSGQLLSRKIRSVSSKETDSENKAGDAKVTKTIGRHYNSSSSMQNLPQNAEDQLEAKIHSILTNIPARIRLTSGLEDDAMEVQRPRATSLSKADNDSLTPLTVRDKAQTALPSMTLVAASSKTSKSRTPTGESEIKLYHLHQPGKDVPIKLYVRLVGEGGERVMVRVGGGWADLGEYLKEYASHHGRRSVSDGRFELHGLPASQSTMSVTTLAGFKSGGPSTPSTPGSPEFQSSSSIPNRRLRLSDASTTESKVPNTPEVLANTQQVTTPGSGDPIVSRHPPSRLSWADDDAPLGLSGPTSKKKEISPGKRAWVEGMLDQAKKASAEKRRSDAGDLGDLGKVGGTRRVFLKAKKEYQ